MRILALLISGDSCDCRAWCTFMIIIKKCLITILKNLMNLFYVLTHSFHKINQWEEIYVWIMAFMCFFLTGPKVVTRTEISMKFKRQKPCSINVFCNYSIMSQMYNLYLISHSTTSYLCSFGPNNLGVVAGPIVEPSSCK